MIEGMSPETAQMSIQLALVACADGGVDALSSAEAMAAGCKSSRHAKMAEFAHYGVVMFQERRRAELAAGDPPATGLLPIIGNRYVLVPPARTLADVYRDEIRGRTVTLPPKPDGPNP